MKMRVIFLRKTGELVHHSCTMLKRYKRVFELAGITRRAGYELLGGPGGLGRGQFGKQGSSFLTGLPCAQMEKESPAAPIKTGSTAASSKKAPDKG